MVRRKLVVDLLIHSFIHLQTYRIPMTVVLTVLGCGGKHTRRAGLCLEGERWDLGLLGAIHMGAER